MSVYCADLVYTYRVGFSIRGAALIRLILSVFVMICSPFSLADKPIEVKVGGYSFPPFIVQQGEQLTGISMDVLSALNENQSDYHFTMHFMPAKRRYECMNKNRIHMILFESPEWEWHNLDVVASDLILLGRDIYITKSGKDRDQTYFNDFSDKKMVGIVGYHYGFSDFITNDKILKEKFNMNLTVNHEASIDMVRYSRADIAVVTESYLNHYTKRYPRRAKSLLVSKKVDQVYEHRIIMQSSGKPSANEINTLLAQLKETGTLKSILLKYGIEY